MKEIDKLYPEVEKRVLIACLISFIYNDVIILQLWRNTNFHFAA